MTDMGNSRKWLAFSYEVGLYAFLSVWLLSSRALGNLGLLLLAACWLCSVACGRSSWAEWKKNGAWALLLFAAVCIHAIFQSPQPADSWIRFYSHSGAGKAVLAALFLLAWHPDDGSLKRLSGVLLLFLFWLNVQQLRYWWPTPILFHPESFSPDAFYKYRNFAAFQLVLLPFLLQRLLAGDCRPGARVGGTLWLMLNLALLGSSGFRGAWLGLLVGAAWMIGWQRGRKMLPYLAGGTALLALLALVVLPPNNLFTAAIKRGASDSQRIETVWKPSLELIGESPWVGHGFAPLAFSQAYEAKRVERNWGVETRPDAHNMFLQFSFQGGWPAGLAYLFLVLNLMRLLRQDSLATPQYAAALVTPAFGAWLGAYLVLGQTDTVDWPCFTLLLPLSAALVGRMVWERGLRG